MSAKVTLTITVGDLQGQQYIFAERTTCIIGRAQDCQIKIPNDEQHLSISRYHCLLDINPPSIRVRDFGSKNGTYLNREKIGQRQKDQTPEDAAQMNFPEHDVKAGDIIKVGNTIFQVSINIPKNTPHPESHPSNPKGGFFLPSPPESPTCGKNSRIYSGDRK